MFRHVSNKIIRFTATGATVLIAIFILWRLYDYYTFAPQTRDGKIRADVISLATEVSGRVKGVYVEDNQKVHKGQLILSLDKLRFKNNVEKAHALTLQAKTDLDSAQREYQRYLTLRSAASTQDRDMRKDSFEKASAAYKKAIADEELAKIDLQQSDLYSPVDGIISNFSLRPGAYVVEGQPFMALVDVHSYYISGYFEETKISGLRIGAPVIIRIMGEKAPLKGHVGSISAGISDSERLDSSEASLPDIAPTFNWIRLAQRVPVRIVIDEVPESIELISGRTVSVTVTSNKNTGLRERLLSGF